MTVPKFLICTMWCGEPDFSHCVEAIRNQEGVQIEHRVFKDMVEVDAHNAVYQSFNVAEPGVIRGKVDADVVLNPGALLQVAQNCNADSWVDPQTHDYFTDCPLHAGLAFYGHNVRFKHQTLTLKCDRDVASQQMPTRLGVLGKHAFYADEWVGFRYGFHRGLKSQLPVFDLMKAAHLRHGDAVRLAAIRGFALAQSDLYIDYHMGRLPPPVDHNYGNPKLRELFERYYTRAEQIPIRTWG